MARIVVGISGASGVILGHKAVLALIQEGHFVELVISKAAHLTAAEEIHSFPKYPESVTLHAPSNFAASIASGSYPHDGMLVIPCSMATLAAIALGLSDNLLRRSADVTIKEKRPLTLVPRETPLSPIHLEHMLTLSRLGVTILPPVPAWYTHPQTLNDIENFIVGKALDSLKINHSLYPRWKAAAV